jgi:hypothetical protein
MSSSEFKLNLAVVIGMNDYQKGISAFIEDANAIAEPPYPAFFLQARSSCPGIFLPGIGR